MDICTVWHRLLSICLHVARCNQAVDDIVDAALGMPTYQAEQQYSRICKFRDT